jgi:FAD/FMN-containing dehydrogenase
LAIWLHVYDAVTTMAGRYVQGGGCTTVGVAGLVQSGGFGSFSKNYGTAAASLLEAEVVTADGAVRIANACTNRPALGAEGRGSASGFLRWEMTGNGFTKPPARLTPLMPASRVGSGSVIITEMELRFVA